jgi:transcriptional regulator of acetoin/glycerol metabolism
MSNNGVIELAHLPPEIAPPDTNYTPLSDNPLELAERDVFANKFAAHRGNIAAVARSLKLSRATVYKKLREYRII